MTDIGEIKRDRSRNRRWLLRRGAQALPFILADIPASAAERIGSVEDVKGEAFAEFDAARRTLDPAAPVFIGDEVATGIASRLGMRLGADTMVRLGEQARLKIDRFLDLRQPALAIGGARSWRRSNGAGAACAAPTQSTP